MKSISVCPVCKIGKLVEGTNGYVCNHFVSLDDKCSFTLFYTYNGKEISEEIALQLVENCETEIFDDFKTKEGKTYSAKLVLEQGHVKLRLIDKALNTPCPACNKKVFIKGAAFVCEGYFNDRKCNFYLNRFIAGYELSIHDAETLIQGNSTAFIEGFVNSKGSEFGARIFLQKESANNGAFYYNTKFDFEIMKCPKCKSGSIGSNQKAYGCSNFRDKDVKCDFVIWKNIGFRPILIKEVEALCKEGSTNILNGFKSKKGDNYSGKLTFSDDFKVIIV